MDRGTGAGQSDSANRRGCSAGSARLKLFRLFFLFDDFQNKTLGGRRF